MKKGPVILTLLAFVPLAMLGGCATMNKKGDTEAQSLKGQVSDLEAKIQQKDTEIAGLRQALSKTTEEKYNQSRESQPSATQVPTPTQIQKALKNAGFDPGEADGKMGSKTRKAVREFQKTNGLNADGKVGPKTWNALVQYLDKK